MRFFEEMNSKYGFSDGEAVPVGAAEYREVYLRVINAFAKKRGSRQRMIAWNRARLHNWCIVLEVTEEFFDSLKSDDERFTTGPEAPPTDAQQPQTRDAGWQQAIEDAEEADLDQYVNVRVTIAKNELKKLCRRIG